MWPSRLPIAGLLLITMAALAGCDRAGRHEVLTFFFTGVPPVDYEEKLAAAARLKAEEEAARLQAATQAENRKIAAIKEYGGPFTHGPYAAQTCEECHEMSTTGGFGFGGGSDKEATKSIVPGRFVQPLELVCTAVCHTAMRPDTVAASGLWLHGPATACVTCHHPHSSPNRYMLTVPVEQLCRQCHAIGFISATDAHTGKQACLECHNPHLGRNAHMLKSEYHEE